MQSISFYSILALSIAGPSFIQAAPIVDISDFTDINKLLGVGAFSDLGKSNLSDNIKKEEIVEDLKNDITETEKINDGILGGRAQIKEKSQDEQSEDVIKETFDIIREEREVDENEDGRRSDDDHRGGKRHNDVDDWEYGYGEKDYSRDYEHGDDDSHRGYHNRHPHHNEHNHDY